MPKKKIDTTPEEAEQERLRKKAYMKDYRAKNKDKIAAQTKAYNEANADKVKSRKKTYNDANKDKTAARWQTYYQDNREHLCQKARDNWQEIKSDPAAHQRYTEARRESGSGAKYREANREKLRQQAKDAYHDPSGHRKDYLTQWAKANCDLVSEYKTANRQNRRAAEGQGLTAQDIRDCKAMSDGICPYCLNPLELFTKYAVHIDHVIPLDRDGRNDPENCLASCAECNLNKSTKTPLEFMFGWNKVTDSYGEK